MVFFRLLCSMLWHCWLGVRKSMRPVKIEWWGVCVVIRLERGADCLHIVQLMPLPSPNPIISCLFKIQTGLTFLVLAYPGSPRKETVKQVCICSAVHLLSSINAVVIHYLYLNVTCIPFCLHLLHLFTVVLLNLSDDNITGTNMHTVYNLMSWVYV